MSLNSVFKQVDSGIRGIGAITTADMWIPDVLKEEPIQKKYYLYRKMAFIRRRRLTYLCDIRPLLHLFVLRTFTWTRKNSKENAYSLI